jgi:hypothetical protein
MHTAYEALMFTIRNSFLSALKERDADLTLPLISRLRMLAALLSLPDMALWHRDNFTIPLPHALV